MKAIGECLDFSGFAQRMERRLERFVPCEQPACGVKYDPRAMVKDSAGRLVCPDCYAATITLPWSPPHSGLLIPERFGRPYRPRANGEDAAALSWSGRPACLSLFGPSRAGKSHLASAVLIRMAKEGRGRFVRSGWLAESEPRERRDLSEVAVVVVDDLGYGHGADFLWERLGLVLLERIDANRPTIITSRVSLETIGQRDGSLMNRLAEGLVVELASPWGEGT